ncbi:MAG: hypothetical protein KGL39_52790 [Patescibacteria group bacterium]|nr:hypothetical protein [Patescibacteria group bacterium]
MENPENFKMNMKTTDHLPIHDYGTPMKDLAKRENELFHERVRWIRNLLVAGFLVWLGYELGKHL